jgi:hypothetical protein
MWRLTMTINEIADYILDIHDMIRTLTPKEIPPTVEGGIDRLIRAGLSDWTIYKIYCAWLELDELSTKEVLKFTKIYNQIEEAVHEQGRGQSINA